MITLIFEDRRKGFADSGFVVHHEQMRSWGHRVASLPLWSAMEAGVNSAAGSSTRKREPTGRLSSTWMLPPCSATIRAAIARPRPVPRSFVENCGRNSLSLSCGEIPCPVSETQISTVSASEWALVETTISRQAEFSNASAALSMRFTTTLRSNTPSARTAGRFSARIVLRVMPSSRPRNTSTAWWTMVLAFVVASLALGKRTNWENSLTSAASVETSRSIKREHSRQVVQDEDVAGVRAARSEGANSDGKVQHASGDDRLDLAGDYAHAQGSAHQVMDGAGRIGSEESFESVRVGATHPEQPSN